MTHLLILTTGSHGDHAPYAGLGHALAQHGHRVTLAAPDRFGHLARDAGLGFAALPEPAGAAPTGTDPATTERSRRANAGGVRGLRTLIELGVEQVRHQLPAIVSAVADADVVAATVATLLYAQPIAEAHDLPLVVLPLQPAVATREFAAPAAGGPDLGPLLNRGLTELGGRLVTRMYRPVVREVRQSLGLAPDDPHADARVRALPTLHGFSPAVQPRPRDWPPGAQVVGYWTPRPPDGWQPPAELLAFLADGPPPVFVGFGSMDSHHTARLGAAVTDALARTGHRAIIQRGWARLDVDTSGLDVLVVDHVPHDWLFPQVAAVVHHGGAGTTAAVLRAGVPSVPVAHAHDQPFWARRLVELGTAPARLSARTVTAARLAAAVAQAVGAPSYRHRAARLSESLATDDAVTPVLRHL